MKNVDKLCALVIKNDWDMTMNKKIIVGISGASGAIYGLRLLEALKHTGSIEIFLTISQTGKALLL